MNQDFEKSLSLRTAILADVEPGFQRGGKGAATKTIPVGASLFRSLSAGSGRQDAALYGRPEARRHTVQTGS
jgi:hypothetical protein